MVVLLARLAHGSEVLDLSPVSRSCDSDLVSEESAISSYLHGWVEISRDPLVKHEKTKKKRKKKLSHEGNRIEGAF